MSDLYTALNVTPRKKRTLPEDDDDVLTPKQLRTKLPTPPATVLRKTAKGKGPVGPPPAKPLPAHLNRLHTIQTALQYALSHALATCAISPSSETGIVRNVLNHLSLGTYSGLTTKFDIDDLRRLCWVWEWDGKTLPTDNSCSASNAQDEKAKAKATSEDDDNPFLDEKPTPVAKGKSKVVIEDDDNPFIDAKPAPAAAKEWTRGAMGFIIAQTTHFSKTAGSRVPAYGIGIEVEMDIDKDMGGGMAAVARWTAASEDRRKEFRKKLEAWSEMYQFVEIVPHIPLVTLPPLPTPKQPSTLTRLLASSSPKSPSSRSILETPTSPSPFAKSPSKSPAKRSLREFAVPFPITPSSRATSPAKTPSKNTILFPQTPSSRGSLLDGFSTPTSLRTPTSSFSDTPPSSSSPAGSSVPSTPAHQRGSAAFTAPETPTSSRRAALAERIRQRSLTATPTKPNPFNRHATPSTPRTGLTKDALLKLSQEEMRRRCLLGRLEGVAESVWMLFSAPSTTSSSSSTPARKRRALPVPEVVAAVVKSSPVPISTAEARESIDLLVTLCPFFVRRMDVGAEEWLEMPAPSASASAAAATLGSSLTDGDGDGSPSKSKTSMVPPSSPGRARSRAESAEELLLRSPRRVKREGGGLREVRERIRRERESQD